MPKTRREPNDDIIEKRLLSNPKPIINKKKKKKKNKKKSSTKNKNLVNIITSSKRRPIYSLSPNLLLDPSKIVIIGEENDDNGAKVDYFPNLFLSNELDLLERKTVNSLKEEVDWKSETIKIFGKETKVPRMGKYSRILSGRILNGILLTLIFFNSCLLR